MSVFLTPDLTPFYGGTYFPPDDRYAPAPAELQAAARRRSPTPGRTAATSIAEVGQNVAELPAGRERPGEPSDGALSPELLLERAGGRCGAASTRRTAASAAPRSSRTPWNCACCCASRKRFNDADGAAHGPPHARPDGPRRHVRPARRRLPPLQRRRAVARPALREDALRQRPARPRPMSRRARRPATRSTSRSPARRSTTSCAR